METSIKCIKYSLFLFNLLFAVSQQIKMYHDIKERERYKPVCYILKACLIFPISQLSGLLLIVVGGVIQGAYSQYLDFLGDQFFNTPVFLVVVGCIIFFVAFFGCCGAIKENHCMTTTFAVLMGVIFLMEIGAGIAAYKLKGQVDRNHNLVNFDKAVY